MTAPVLDPQDPVRLFLAALQPRARTALNMTQQAAADVHTAITAGWGIEDLAADVQYHAIGLDNADQVMRHRLHRIAHPDETTELSYEEDRWRGATARSCLRSGTTPSSAPLLLLLSGRI